MDFSSVLRQSGLMNATGDKTSILQIRHLASQVGAARFEIPDLSDAENYEVQVQVGLACSAAAILKGDISRMIDWFGHCLIACGVKIDSSTESLLDDLEQKIESVRGERSA